MKSLRKSILTLLALTLFGGAGAWAQQGPTQVTQFTTDLIASWQTDNSALTLADMQALGFVAVDESVAAAWTGAPQDGHAFLFNDFDGGIGTVKFILFNNGNMVTSTQSSYTKSWLYNEVAGGTNKFFYTGSPAIELTKEGANQWTLGQTPDYDLELQVEYYQKYALKDIPAGWTVLINGHDSTSHIVEGSLNITETDTVTLVPAGNPRRVKSVTLEDEGPAVQTITVDGLQLNYVEGENWVQTADRNPDVLTTDSYYVFKKNSTIVLLAGEQTVSPTSTYDPSLNYYWEQW